VVPIIDLPQGQLRYRLAGPSDSTTPPVVFLHGLLVNSELWIGAADHLAAAGVRSYAPDLLLGSHPIALRRDADLTPRGVARLLSSFLAALVRGVRRDTAKFLRGVDPAKLLEVSTRLRRFTKPVLLLWGGADSLFPISLAHRLQNILPNARLVEIPYGRLFFPHDEPQRVADEI
jgi:pimeloyl-ACP methyl ester carboxylesterase